MNGFNVITVLFGLKENGVSAPNGALRICGMMLKARLWQAALHVCGSSYVFEKDVVQHVTS